jgi:hypothetical protein
MEVSISDEPVIFTFKRRQWHVVMDDDGNLRISIVGRGNGQLLVRPSSGNAIICTSDRPADARVCQCVK